MYGLENKKKKNFQFDLEVEIKANPKKGKELLENIGANLQELKKSLKQQKTKKETEEIGVLIHGYTALEKVTNKIIRQ